MRNTKNTHAIQLIGRFAAGREQPPIAICPVPPLHTGPRACNAYLMQTQPETELKRKAAKHVACARADAGCIFRLELIMQFATSILAELFRNLETCCGSKLTP